MSSKLVRCEFCKDEKGAETCELATHRTVIEGKEYLFCCAKRAERYQRKKL